MAARRKRAGQPLIGITGGDRRLPWGWWFAAAAVRRAGGRPLRITPKRPLASGRTLDGLIVGGGDDIDPALYTDTDGGAPVADPARDRLELALLAQALEAGLPILGICRGAQLLNVALGGSLYADIRPRRRKTSNRRTPFARKTVRLRGSSRLARICGAPVLRINSLHHQAVQRLGHGLRTVARDLDGIKQAVEDPRAPFRIGVQWHPEYLPRQRAQRRLFAALVGRARRRANRAASEA